MNSNQSQGRQDDANTINVAPGDDDAPASGISRPPQSINQTQAWQASRAGMNRMWTNYRQHLARSFKGLSRWSQESLIQRLCIIITIGVTGLALLLFYQFIHRSVRVFLVPAAIVGAWWAANRIVTPVVLARLENLLNKE